MYFIWNGVNSVSLGILAELEKQPIKPAPKLVLEEIPGRSGFYDLSAFNPERKVAQSPITWVFRCGFEHRVPTDYDSRIALIQELLAEYSGTLVVDKYPGKVWSGVISQTVEATESGTVTSFGVTFVTQPEPVEG